MIAIILTGVLIAFGTFIGLVLGRAADMGDRHPWPK